jgi:hypothetical protein
MELDIGVAGGGRTLGGERAAAAGLGRRRQRQSDAGSRGQRSRWCRRRQRAKVEPWWVGLHTVKGNEGASGAGRHAGDHRVLLTYGGTKVGHRRVNLRMTAQ